MAGLRRRGEDGKTPAKPYRGNAGRFFRGKSRTQERIENKLGRIPGEQMGKFKRFRSDELARLDAYMRNEQYDKLMPWDSSDKDTYIPIRMRKPRVIYNVAKPLVDTVAGKLVGEQTFPRFSVEDDPDTEQVLGLVSQASNLRLHVLYTMRKMLAAGSSFVRFWIVGTKIRMESFDAKVCYPTFNDANDLEEIEVRHVYEDENDLDERGTPKQKWYRLYLSTTTDILYDNPEYKPGGEEPEFEEVARVEHNLGFVQGQWFKASECKDADGESLIAFVTELIDALNYSLSQADQAVAYAQEPQLAVKGMDVDEIDELIKSSERAWSLGRQGEAGFIEADLSGVQRGAELRTEKKQRISDVTRVVLLDPEKIVGNAQSAKAMEVLHGPLVDLVHELRAVIAPSLQELITKMFAVIFLLEQEGMNEVLVLPAGWQPKSTQVTLVWPEIFAMTMEDLQKKCAVAASVVNANLISRETATKWIAKDFGVENPEEEANKVNTQTQLNTYSMF